MSPAERILDDIAREIAMRNDELNRCGGMRLPVGMAARYRAAMKRAEALDEPERGEALLWLSERVK